MITATPVGFAGSANAAGEGTPIAVRTQTTRTLRKTTAHLGSGIQLISAPGERSDLLPMWLVGDGDAITCHLAGCTAL